MLKPKSGVLSVAIAGVFLLGAGTTQAHATFTITTTICSGSGIPTLCIEGAEGKLFEAEGTEKYKGKLVPGTEAIFGVSTLGLEIACKKDASEGEVVQTEPLVKAVVAKKGFLTFSECAVLSPTTCHVPETIKSEALEGEVIDEMPIDAGIARAESGGTIVTITLEGASCPATLVGTNSVKGSDLCLSAEAEVDLSVHTGECKAEGSSLKFAGSAAYFECKGEGELAGANKEKKSDVTLA